MHLCPKKLTNNLLNNYYVLEKYALNMNVYLKKLV